MKNISLNRVVAVLRLARTSRFLNCAACKITDTQHETNCGDVYRPMTVELFCYVKLLTASVLFTARDDKPLKSVCAVHGQRR